MSQYELPHIPLKLAFDDVLLVPQYSEITSRSQVSTRAQLAGDIFLDVPIISSNMDTVTMADMAIAMAKLGGIGFIHRFLSIEDEVAEIAKVKRYRSHVILNPYEVDQESTIRQATKLMDQYGVGGLMVTQEESQLIGILTRRDVYGADGDALVKDMMTSREQMIVGTEDIEIQEAKRLMHSGRVEKLPLVNDDNKVVGLIVMKDIRKLADNPHSTLDSSGRLMVASSVGVVNEYIDRAEATLAAGADLLVVDVAHGHASHVGKAVAELKKRFDVPIIAGDVATGEGVEYLAKSGADAVRIGIGPGCAIAGTRILMANGNYKNIEDVQIGDRVINQHGKPVDVIGTKNSGLRKVRQYRHTAYHKPSGFTSDHLHLVGNLNSMAKSTLTSQGYQKAMSTNIGNRWESKDRIQWRRLDELSQDIFLSPRDIQFEMPVDIKIDLTQYGVREKSLARYNTQIFASEALGYMLGTFLGDGCSKVTPNRNSEAGSVSWYFGLEETAIVERCVDAVETVTGVRPTVTQKGNINLVSLYSLQWARLLQDFGKGPDKHLPEELLCSHGEYLDGLYQGLLDSDGHIAADGRISFDNTSSKLHELFGILCYIKFGTFPSSAPKNNDSNPTGGLQGADPANMNPAYTTRLNVSHAKRLLPEYQAIKKLELTDEGELLVPTYDIEVDCPTHSFIANNVIVHNSACTTRLVAGAGVPQFSALLECSIAGKKVGIPVIADGGIRAGSPSSPGGADLSKAIGAGASTAMLGSALAGTRESPGLIEERDGRQVKTYRGMASMDAFLSKQVGEGKADEAAVEYVPEGVTSVIPFKDETAAQVIHKLVGGLRSGMAYSDARTIEEFHDKAKFVQQTSAGLGESKPHVLDRGPR